MRLGWNMLWQNEWWGRELAMMGAKSSWLNRGLTAMARNAGLPVHIYIYMGKILFSPLNYQQFTI
jgi:hypothetical protein